MADTLVTAKVHPDLDGTACILAYTDLLNQQGVPADPGIFGTPQAEVEYFSRHQGFVIPTRQDDGVGSWSKFVLVDMSATKGNPRVVKPERVIEIIDHRKSEPEKEFPHARVQNDLIGAAATIVVERYQAVGKKLTSENAQLLYGAIFHNTLNFLASNTHQRDRDAAAYLEETYGCRPQIAYDMFQYADRIITEDIARAIENDAKEFAAYNTVIGAYQLILWNFQPGEWSEKIAAAVGETDQKMGCQWSYLGVIDLKTNTNYIYCPSVAGQEKFHNSLGITFTHQWASLHPALLRKQIIPKLTQ